MTLICSYHSVIDHCWVGWWVTQKHRERSSIYYKWYDQRSHLCYALHRVRVCLLSFLHFSSIFSSIQTSEHWNHTSTSLLKLFTLVSRVSSDLTSATALFSHKLDSKERKKLHEGIKSTPIQGHSIGEMLCGYLRAFDWRAHSSSTSRSWEFLGRWFPCFFGCCRWWRKTLIGLQDSIHT